MSAEADRFDPELATEFSLAVHEACKNCCPHDIGIALAVIAHRFYSKEDIGVEIEK
jgi:hypothetical protein